MGSESINPFVKDRSKGAFVICKTSNPSSKDLQESALTTGEAVFERVAALCQLWNTNDNVGVVVGATDVSALQRVRKAAPDLWILAPGMSAQGVIWMKPLWLDYVDRMGWACWFQYLVAYLEQPVRS